MARLDILLSGYDITDEVINRSSSSSLKLDHDTIRGTADIEIWTGAGGTGTQLALTTDYTVAGEDTRLSTAVGGAVSVYTTLAIVNGAYHSTDLYVTYKTVGDYASVSSIEKASGAVGDIKMIAYETPDDGWLLCNGKAVSRSTYATLFAKIGTIWGVGDGSTTFNVPDIREAVPVGVGTFSAVTGTTRGAQDSADVYTLGQFKDDQIEDHWHNGSTADGGGEMQGVSSGVVTNATETPSRNGVGSAKTNGTYTIRAGSVTRGKRIGINFVIKY